MVLTGSSPAAFPCPWQRSVPPPPSYLLLELQLEDDELPRRACAAAKRLEVPGAVWDGDLIPARP